MTEITLTQTLNSLLNIFYWLYAVAAQENNIHDRPVWIPGVSLETAERQSCKYVMID